MNKLRILQLSDIHNVSCPRALDAFRPMRKGLLKDVKDYCDAEACSFDAILICGDIAYSGLKEEYEKSKSFIEALCDKAGCKMSQVFIVPGNHDKILKEGKPAVRRLLNWGITHLDEKENMFQSLMTDEAELFSNLYLPFKHYLDFSKGFDNVEPMMQKCVEERKDADFKLSSDNDEMFWKAELADDFYGYQVNLVGFNSALTCDENDWSFDWNQGGHKVYLSTFSYDSIELPDDKAINIVMMHHPMSCIVCGEDLAEKFDEQYLLQFYGHIHEADSSQVCKGGAVRMFSGAMQPPVGATDEEKKKYFPIYNVVELGFSAKEGNQMEVNLIVNKWNGKAFELYREQSKSYQVDLPVEQENRWKKQKKVKAATLPDGVSKREMHCLFQEYPNQKKIVGKMYDNLYDNAQSAYVNGRKFFVKIEEDNRWMELWSLLKS